MIRAICTLGLVLLAGCAATTPRPPVRTPAGILEGIADGRTEVVDLTHALSSANPHWPGPGYEPFAYEIFATIEDDGVLSGRFTMAEHTGTHIDAPSHFTEGQIPVDGIPLDQLIVQAVVIDARAQVREDPDYLLTPEDVLGWEDINGLIPPNTLVFMYTGWDERWSDFDSYKNADQEGKLHFPGFSPESAELLTGERDVAGLGIDTLSVDYGLSEDFQVHHVSHGRAKYHLENVANLGELPATGTQVIVAPIKIAEGTGGPARIFALVQDDSN
jgi:kynurenine formamidase